MAQHQRRQCQFIDDRAAVRRHLLEVVDSIGERLDADQADGDRLRHLPPTTLAALRDSGLLALKVPQGLGGYEADSALQFEVVERTAYFSSIAAWCLFIYTDSYGKAAAHLSEEGVELLSNKGTDPVMFGGGGLLFGTLKAASGGVRISGRWIYGSGLAGADWAMLFGKFPEDEGRDPLVCVVPQASVTSLDNWDVLGLKGTGSTDFTVTDIFVPDALTWPMPQPALRGGHMYAHSLIGFGGHAIPAVALGVARRALDDAARLAASKARGYDQKITLAHRGAFQSFLGRADLRLKAARGFVLDLCGNVAETPKLSSAQEAEFRAAGSYVVQEATDIVTELISYIGGDGIRAAKRFERAVRDLQTARTHFTVSNGAWENHAQFLLGLDGADPLR